MPLTPNVRFRTSGASEEPPIPSRTNAVYRVRASDAKSRSSSTRSSIRFGSSSQPSHLSSSSPVHSVESRAQMRSTRSCWEATTTPLHRRQLALLHADAVHELFERVRELLHAFLLERLHDVAIVDSGLTQILKQCASRVNTSGQRLGDLAVVLKCLDRLLGHRVHRLRAGQLLDVHRVA